MRFLKNLNTPMIDPNDMPWYDVASYFLLGLIVVLSFGAMLIYTIAFLFGHRSLAIISLGVIILAAFLRVLWRLSR